MARNRIKFEGSLKDRIEKAKFLSYNNVRRNFDDYFNDYSKTTDLNKDDLLRDNLRYAKEDALQQYKTQKKSLILTYLLIAIFWLFLPNYYAGRKRLAKIELGLIILILGTIILSVVFEISDEAIAPYRDFYMYLFIGFWVFDIISLWIVVVDHNYSLYIKLLKGIAEKTGFTLPKQEETYTSADLSPVNNKKSQVSKFSRHS